MEDFNVIHRNEARVIDRKVEFKDRVTGEICHYYVVSVAKSPGSDCTYMVQIREEASAKVLSLSWGYAVFDDPDKAFEATFSALEGQHPDLKMSRLPGEILHK